MATTRRRFVRNGLTIGAGTTLLPGGFAWAEAEAGALEEAVATSPLVYVSPLRSNGEESVCHGEVWFVAEAGDLLVVSDAERWRATALAKGLDQARLWVGDHGVWKRSKGRFREAPRCDAKASLENDPAVHARALGLFGEKYASAWGTWGPRFQEGLASGERVLIRYSPRGR